MPERGGGERFAPGLTLGAARARLFALGGLGDDGGYGDALGGSETLARPPRVPEHGGAAAGRQISRPAPRPDRVSDDVAGRVRDRRVGGGAPACGVTGSGGCSTCSASPAGSWSSRAPSIAPSCAAATARTCTATRGTSRSSPGGSARCGAGSKLDGEDACATRDDRVAFAFWGGVSVLTYVATLAVMLRAGSGAARGAVAVARA